MIYVWQGTLEMQKKAMQRQENKAISEEEIKTWITQEIEILMATIEADYSLEKLMQDRASLVYQLEQLIRCTTLLPPFSYRWL